MSDASPASKSGGSASASLLSHSSSWGFSRGHDPPSLAAATRASSTAVSRNTPLPPPPRCPDPDGVASPSSVSGGMGGLGGLRFVGRFASSYGFLPSRTSFNSGFSTTSTAEHYCQFHFPGTIPEAVPTVVFGGDRHLPTPGGFCHAPPPPSHDRHVPASVAAASALAASPLRPLSREDLSASSASDLTMSILFTYVWYAYPRSLSLWSRLPHYLKLDYLVTRASSRRM